MKLNKVITLVLISTTFICMGLTNKKDNNVAGDYDYLKERIENTKKYTIEVFEAMPEDDYSYKPNEGVRSYGALAFHVAYSIEWNIKLLKGTPVKWTPGNEDRLSKKELIAYANEQFKNLFTFIKEAKENPELTDKLIDILNHNAHHRGQMTIYLRMKGIKPPDYR